MIGKAASGGLRASRARRQTTLRQRLGWSFGAIIAVTVIALLLSRSYLTSVTASYDRQLALAQHQETVLAVEEGTADVPSGRALRV